MDVTKVEALQASGALELLKEFVELTRKRRALQAQVDELRDRLIELGGGVKKKEYIFGELCNVFIDQELKNIRVDGMTIFIKRDVGLSINKEIDPEMSIEKVRAAGFGDFINQVVDTAKIRNVLKEELKTRTDDGEVLTFDDVIPEELKGIVNTYERFALQGLETKKESE